MVSNKVHNKVPLRGSFNRAILGSIGEYRDQHGPVMFFYVFFYNAFYNVKNQVY